MSKEEHIEKLNWSSAEIKPMDEDNSKTEIILRDRDTGLERHNTVYQPYNSFHKSADIIGAYGILHNEGLCDGKHTYS